MEAYVKRMLDERTELEAKLEKLGAFILGGPFKLLPEEEQKLMEEQHGLMAAYKRVLSRRIELATKTGATT